MKKVFRILFAIGIVFSVFLASAPKAVEAKDTKVAAGAWTTGKEVDVDDFATSPTEWMTLLTKGVKVTEPGTICHPFRGGQYHWVGEIRQLQKNGTWSKLVTTNDWVPTTEGQFMSCAEAPTAGTYALFGYYNGPQEYFATENGITGADVSITTGSIIFQYTFAGYYGPVTYGQAKGTPYFLNPATSSVQLRRFDPATCPWYYGGWCLTNRVYLQDINLDYDGKVEYADCQAIQNQFIGLNFVPDQVYIILIGVGNVWSKGIEIPLDPNESLLLANGCNPN